MSELNFNVPGNNADFQKETQQLHDTIGSLESDFKALRRSGCSSSAAFEY